MATLADLPALTRIAHPALTPADVRSAAIADPGFGRVFTDHMVVIDWSEELGWHNATLGPRGPIALDPAAAVLHYAQEIFEGLKAYRLADGSMGLFRPDENARRFNASAQRLAMPEIPEELFVDAVRQLVLKDAAWFPQVDGGSLYIRPFMFASEPFLGVRPANAEGLGQILQDFDAACQRGEVQHGLDARDAAPPRAGRRARASSYQRRVSSTP